MDPLREMSRSARSFLNIDVDLRSERSLEPLLEALGAEVLVLTHRLDETGSFASLELAEPPEEVEAIVERLCGVFEGLEGEACACWASCTQRTFNLGFLSWEAAPGAPTHCQECPLSPQILVRVGALGVGLMVSVYAQ